MSKWLVYAKKADFKGIADKYGIDQVIVRIIRNRDVCTLEELDSYLDCSLKKLHNPRLLKDVEKAVAIILDKIKCNKPIRIIGDYDIDGVCSTAILCKAFKAAGANVDYTVPHRITDGYGINEHLIDIAYEDGIDTIVTCDNGIAAIDQINYAKQKGMTVIVTDHHDIPFREQNGEKLYLESDADAIVNPKQLSCQYPFKLLCGAAVAYKLVEVLSQELEKAQSELSHENAQRELKSITAADLEEYRQLAAIATVGDVVDLKDENRIFVKYGLKSLATTGNVGIRSLAEACKMDITHLTAYHIGFIIGPCLNASGRLDSAKKAVELLLENDLSSANAIAQELCSLNVERKDMTEQETIKAIDMVETTDLRNDKVLVVYLPSCHESVAGIIAGRLREHFYKPVFVITDAEHGAKGSGRSIDGYNMFEEISKCAELLTKFGGHPLAAGLSLPTENIEIFRKMLNDNQRMTEEDLTPVTWIDVPMPVSYVNFGLINQLDILEPFGKGNEKPVFADKNLTVRSANLIGRNANVLKLSLESSDGYMVEAIQFKADAINIPSRGQVISMVYYPSVNEYNGKKSIQFIIKEWR